MSFQHHSNKEPASFIGYHKMLTNSNLTTQDLESEGYKNSWPDPLTIEIRPNMMF